MQVAREPEQAAEFARSHAGWYEDSVRGPARRYAQGRRARRTIVACVMRCAAFVMAIFAFAMTPCLAARSPTRATFGASVIDERSGAPVFTYRGRPFFVYGAAFFYDRMPRDTWRAAMLDLKIRLHVNTLDLYVPWNWHELADGEFDFSGRTNPRRDVREVLRLAHEFGFALIVRPGPVIRNEWKNAGYPGWLLREPAYGMPLRDRLEGRYPPTATLQNARSDDAAAAWLQNATHVRYARRWLRTALREFVPYSHDVIAIALDDDQGAYIDNQTWPAPHLRAYLTWLRACVASVTGGRVPVFINTYQMKVTASSPVWAMGNWYQSDAFAIGEHDRTQLEFSTGLLQTRPHQPLMASEFQAGWLQPPQDVLPQAADPSNTLLALGTLIGMGVRGVVNFPAQDTLYPAGYEVPFANAFYAWDAALGYSATAAGGRVVESPRGAPTRFVGAEIAAFNPLLAAASVDADAAIVSLPSAYDERGLSNADIAMLAERTMTAQRFCRHARLTCALVDLRYGNLSRLRAFPMLIVPLPERGALQERRFVPSAARLLAAYRRSSGKTVFTTAEPSSLAVKRAFRKAQRAPYVTFADGSFAEDPATGAGFLSLLNYANAPHAYPRIVIRSRGGRRFVLPHVSIAARSAALLAVNVPLRFYDARFGSADRLTATCPIVGVARAPALDVARGGAARVRLAFAVSDVRSDCRFFASLAERNVSYRLPLHTTRVIVDRAGGIASDSHVGRMRATQARIPTSKAARGTLPIRSDVLAYESPRATVGRNAARAYVADVYRDGQGALVLENDRVRLIVAPAAGARAFVFEDKARATSMFTTVGALRDDVLVQPPLSAVDRIAKYTNQMPAGFFNRPYRAHVDESGARAVVRFSYAAPDAYPQGARFSRLLSLEAHARCFTADLTSRFEGTGELARRQRAVSVTSLAVGNVRAPQAWLLSDRVRPLAKLATQTLSRPQHALGLFDPASHELALVAWSASREPVTLAGRTNSLLLRIAETPGSTTRLAFAYERTGSLAAANERMRTFARDGCAAPAR